MCRYLVPPAEHEPEAARLGEVDRDGSGDDNTLLPYDPRNSKSGHQLIQSTQAGILSLSPG